MDIHERITIAICLLVTGLAIVYGLRSTGVYYDDDISHYLIAKYSWKHPSLFLYTWGRPPFTILYAPAALLGFEAVRLFSALLAGLVCFMTARLAKLYGARWYWLAALFIGFQPEFLRQAFSCLTELTFTLLLCATLIAHRKQKWFWMAIGAGLLPLARYETLPIAFVFAIILLQQKRPGLMLLVAAPLLLHNLYHAVALQSPLALLFPLDEMLGARPGVGGNYIETNDPFHYARLLPFAYGWIILLLAAAGALRSRLGVLHLCALIVVTVVSLVYWLCPRQALYPGWPRYLVAAAPAVAVLAAIGFERLVEIFPQRKAARTYGVGIVVAAVVMAVVAVRPFQITPERIMASKAGRWFITSEYRDRLVLASHCWFTYAADMDRYDERVFQFLTPENIRNAPPGSILVWDSHYSNRYKYKTPLDALAGNPQFREIRRWESDGCRIIAFEKVAE